MKIKKSITRLVKLKSKLEKKVITLERLYPSSLMEVSKSKYTIESKTNYGPNIKLGVRNKFGVEKIFGLSKILVRKKNLVLEKIAPKNFGFSKIMCPIFFCLKRNFASKKILGPRQSLGPKKICVLKICV